MTASQPDNEAIFHAARNIPDPDRRRGYVREACGGDETRIAYVEALLAAADAPDSLLDRPVASDPVATIDQATSESPGTVIGPYKLLEQIGEGGMGTVWMAQQTEPVKRLVAVKLIKAGMDSRQVIARFEAERQALALMEHTNIARVLDAGTTSTGRPYFVMDLVKGVPITRYCDEHHLTPRQRLELFIPVCQAIQHAHQKGIIHRDLKPSNVLVALYDGKPVPKVIDFGVAKAAGQPLTEKTLVTGFGAIVGTLEYMSPEQAEVNQLDIDTRSDIYSLGVLLYELLAGSTPFTKKDLEKAGMLEMLRVIREQEPSKPSTKLSTADGLPTLAANRGTEPAKLTKLVRGELDWIVMKALEKDRSRRYETANGFAMDVQRYLADEAVQACPPSTIYRLKKFVRRNKGSVLAASLVLLALVAGVVGTTWQAVRAANRAEGERLAKERAEANFDFANEAVEKYLGTVTDDPELNQADFNRLRKRLLESAIPFFQKLAARKSDDPAVEARRGFAYVRLTRVRLALEDNEAAVRDAEGARDIFTRLAADFPALASYSHGLAKSQHARARALNRLGRHAEAEIAFGQALGTYSKLAADFPTNPVIREELADVDNDLGTFHLVLGKHEQAEAALRRVLDMREKLVADFQDARGYRQKLAITLSNLGYLLTDLGKSEEAAANLRRAVDIQEKLVAEAPTEEHCRSGLAMDHLNLARVLSQQGKREEEAAAYDHALDIYEKLTAEFPTVPNYRMALGHVHSNRGILLVKLGKIPEAVADFRQAVGIVEKLAAAFPTLPDYQHNLAVFHDHLGSALGKGPDAEAASRRALDIKEKLVAAFPNVPLYSISLGGAYCNCAELHREFGQPEAALAWYQKAIARLEAVLASEPRLIQARQFLCNSQSGRAQTLDALGRHADAARDWQRALELDDGTRRVEFLSCLASSRLQGFRKDRNAVGCLAAAAEYEALKQTDAAALYDAACNRAVCAAVILEDPKTPGSDARRLAQEQADLAVAWLHKAIAAGYKDAEHVKKDKDLDALREREDFKKLLAELETKKKESGVRKEAGITDP